MASKFALSSADYVFVGGMVKRILLIIVIVYPLSFLRVTVLILKTTRLNLSHMVVEGGILV